VRRSTRYGSRDYALAAGRYVGADEDESDEEVFETRYPKLLATLRQQFEVSTELNRRILLQLANLPDE